MRERKMMMLMMMIRDTSRGKEVCTYSLDDATLMCGVCVLDTQCINALFLRAASEEDAE